MFADDTVIFYASNSINEIECVLNEELVILENYFKENDLIVNLKKGKTEYVLLGTRKRLAKSKDAPLELLFGFTKICYTASYKYLGTVIDSTLSMNENFNKVYKKASSRLRLLESLRQNQHLVCITPSLFQR